MSLQTLAVIAASFVHHSVLLASAHTNRIKLSCLAPSPAIVNFLVFQSCSFLFAKLLSLGFLHLVHINGHHVREVDLSCNLNDHLK